MIARNHRFHGYNSLQNVYKQGTTVRGGLVSLRYNNRPTNRPYRVGVVVSKKVSKSAIMRNRIRRRLYEAIRTCQITPKVGQDLVFTVFSDQLAVIDAQQLQRLTQELLIKATNSTV